MKSSELKEKLDKALERVEKAQGTIERHKKQLEKKQAVLLRCEWVKPFLNNLDEIKWDENKRKAYKEATGDDLYWDACDVQHKEEDIKGAYKKLEEQKQIAENWREKYNKQVELETKIEFEMPPIFQQCKEDLAKDWTETDIRRREIMKEKRRELPWKEFRKAYSYNQEQEYGKTDEEFMRINLRDAELFIIDLYNRVKAITGEVTDWKNIHYGGKALNGYVVGENGTARVETILAGGYNIQRLHMRVLVHKMN